MSEYAYQVVRWPFTIASTGLTLNQAGGGSTTITIAAGTYICDGMGSVIAPKDFVTELETRVNAGIIALGGTAVVSFDLATDGHFRWTVSTGDSNRYTITPTADLLMWTGGDSTEDYYAGNLMVCGTTTAQTNTYKFQMYAQWHPGIDADYDSSDLQRQIVSEGRNLKGRVRRVVRSYAPWVERRLDWSRIASGRMSDARAASSLFAGVAGVTTDEDNTWEAMWLYLTGEAGPYGDNRVYVYSTNDPSTAVQTGPYDVILEGSEPGLAGLPSGGYVQGMASEYYAARLALVEGGA